MSDAVTVQVIATVGAVAAAAVPIWLQVRKTRNALGRPNGKGDVVTMLESSLENQRALRVLAEEHEKLDVARFDSLDTRLKAIEQRDTFRAPR